MSEQRAPTGAGRVLQLDVLRGVAILLILGNHPFMNSEDAGVFAPVAAWWYHFGWTAVDLFFVLSGFLIGGLLFNELADRHDLDVRRFLIRRGFKIWPSYYVFLACIAVLYLLRFPPALAAGYPIRDSPWSLARNMAANVLNVQNYERTLRLHTWSLAVEEHFYLILPFVLWWLTRARRAAGAPIVAIPALPYLALGLVAFCTAGRYLASLKNPTDYVAIMLPTHLRIDGLFFGVLLAYWDRFHPGFRDLARRYRYALLGVGVALVFPMMLCDANRTPYVFVFGCTMLYLGYGAVLVSAVATPIGEGWWGRLLGSRAARGVAFIGFYSYPIYLWHIDLARAPLRWLVTSPYWTLTYPSARWVAVMAAYVGLATATGIVMSLAVERPALAMRDRLFPRRSRAVPEAPDSEPADPEPTTRGELLPAAEPRV